MRIPHSVELPVFLLVQVGPPAALLYFVYGRFDIGSTAIIGIPLIFSFIRVPWLLFKRQLKPILRPLLTVIVGVIYMKMGGESAAQSKEIARRMAYSLQEQCNRDGYCLVPAGNWQASDNSSTLFWMETATPVPMLLYLSFNDPRPSAKADCVKGSDPKASVPLKTFRITRLLEDHHYTVYGGLGQTLEFSE